MRRGRGNLWARHICGLVEEWAKTGAGEDFGKGPPSKKTDTFRVACRRVEGKPEAMLKFTGCVLADGASLEPHLAL